MASRRRTIALGTAVAAVAGTGIFAVAAGAASTDTNYHELITCSGQAPAPVDQSRLATLGKKDFLAAGKTTTLALALPTTDTAELPGVTITKYHLVWGAAGISGGTKSGDFFTSVVPATGAGTAISRQPLGQTIPSTTNETWVAPGNVAVQFINHTTAVNAQYTLAVYAVTGTTTQTKTYPGTLCPTGWTKVSTTLNTDNAPADPTPVATPSP